MRPWIPLLAALALCGGCNHLSLERHTVRQGSTMTGLQYQQVLDNLAMFACNPNALAWHLKMSGGTIQVTDQGTGMIGGLFGSSASVSPSITGQRGVVGQWSVIPAVDPEDLVPLQLAYQKALDPLDEEGKIREGIYEQVGELSVRYNIPLDQDTLDILIDNMKAEVDPRTQQPRETPEELEARKWDLKRRNKELHEEVDKQFERMADLSKLRIESDPQVRLQEVITKMAERLDTLRSSDESNPQRMQQMQDQVRQLQEQLSRAARQEAARILTVSEVYAEDRVVKLTREICDLPYIPRYPYTRRVEHNPHDVAQAEDKIESLMDLAGKRSFAAPWVCVGKKKDVPKCACYVGHYKGCDCDCYVWVMPPYWSVLRDFTLAVLNLAPLESQEMPPGLPRGNITYSPTTASGAR